MALRFFKRIKIAPGLSVNLSKRGASVSVGPRGAKITAGTSGARATTGVAGTCLFYTSSLSKSSDAKIKEQTLESVTPQNRGALNIGFFERLLTPAHKLEIHSFYRH